jgi:hypothetical protein
MKSNKNRSSEQPTTTRPHGNHATLIFHHAADEIYVAGEPPKYDFPEPILSWEVSPPKPYDEFPVAVIIRIVKPDKYRDVVCHLIAQDNLCYATIEHDGQVLYDSRTEVPCHMDAFYRTRTLGDAERQRQKAIHLAKGK